MKKWLRDSFKEGLVSVIIPTYNRAHLITTSLDSVFNQKYRPIELIIVDDGSTDNTKKAIENWRKCISLDGNFTIEYIYQSKKNGSAARNFGTIKSNGEFIQYLDSDDLIAPQKIANQVKCYFKLKNMIAVYGDFRKFCFINNTKIFVYKKNSILDPKRALNDWLEGQFTAPHSILWRRTDIINIGPWDESLTLNDDGDFSMRFLLNNGKFFYCPNSWSYYRYYIDSTPRVVSDISDKSINSGLRVIEKIESILRKKEEVDDYKNSLAIAYREIAEDAALTNRKITEHCLLKANSLLDNKKTTKPFYQKVLKNYLGIYLKKRLTQFLRTKLGFQPFLPISKVKNIKQLYEYDH